MPALTLSKTGDGVLLSWPACAVPLDLEATSDPTAPVWTILPQTSAWSHSGEVYIQLPATADAQFYRLHKP